MNFCSYFARGTCRSCSLIETSYDQQVQEKCLQLKEIVKIELEPALRSDVKNFRRKIKISVSGSLSHPILGLAQVDHEAEIYNCPIQSKELNDQLTILYSFIKKYNLTPYSIKERKGELKSIILSYSHQSKEIMLRFVLRSKESFDRIKLGLADLSQFHVISVNLQPIPHAILEGDEEIILTQNQYITHTYQGLKIYYGPKSFMQTNLDVAEVLYSQAREWTSSLNITKVADLFCGSGAFGLHLVQTSREVIGFEVSEEAVKLAAKAAKDQSLKAQFIRAASEDIFDQLENFSPDLVVVNPPRRGLASSLEPLLKLSPPYILYSSCSPESFKKDFDSLSKFYIPLSSKLFDMFPHTHHFESLTLLKRR